MLRMAIFGLLAAIFLCGCSAAKRDPHPVIETTLEAVLDAHNERAAGLDRFWARASVQVIGRTEDGRLREQAEGHLQIVRPDRVALSLGKLGKTQLYLGSNADVYWWIDMVDPDQKSVVFGRHDLVTQRKAELLGVPVYPRDLVGLLGITPIDPARVIGGLQQAKGRLIVDVQVGGGRMRVYFSGLLIEPVRVEMYDLDDRLQVASDLERYDYVTVVGDARSKPRVAEKIVLTLSDDTVVRISLYDPENKVIRDSAFELDRLVRGYRIEQAYDLDDQPEGGP